MPQLKKKNERRWTCRECGTTGKQGRGRPRTTCHDCLKKPSARNVILKGGSGDTRARGNVGGSGRGNVRLRACGCPSRKHLTTCPKSRSFGAKKSPDEIRSAANARSIAAEKRRAAKARIRAGHRLDHKRRYGMKDIPPAMKSMNVYLGCKICNSRGHVSDFKQWDGKAFGICKNCDIKGGEK